jgi:hypothetical protein
MRIVNQGVNSDPTDTYAGAGGTQATHYRAGRHWKKRAAAAISYLAMTVVANYTMTGAADALGYTITKGGLTGYHAGPYSAALAGDFVAKYKLSAVQGGFFGVDTTTAGGISGTDIGFEFDAAGNTAQAKTNASYQGSAITTASTKWFWIRRTGTLVELLYNTSDDITTATIHATTLTTSATLYVNTIVQSAGGVATILVTA